MVTWTERPAPHLTPMSLLQTPAKKHSHTNDLRRILRGLDLSVATSKVDQHVRDPARHKTSTKSHFARC